MEYSIQSFKEIKEQPDFRLDADFYHPRYIMVFNKIDSSWKRLDQISTVSDGDHSKFPENKEGDIRYLRAKDINNNDISDDDPIYVSKSYLNIKNRSLIKEKNILISIMGNIGDITLTPPGFSSCMANRAICIIRNTSISPFVIFGFLLSKYGYTQIKRYKAGGVQQRINLSAIRSIYVPQFSTDFTNLVEIILMERFKNLALAKKFYSESKSILLNEIGLTDFNPKYDTCFSSTLEEVNLVGRMDAEYFQPKYNEIEKKIKSYINGWGFPRELLRNKKSNFIPSKNVQYQYIELANVLQSGEIISVNTYLGSDLPTRAKNRINKNEIIISTIEGSLGNIALIYSEQDNFVCSNGFIAFSSEMINAETLFVFFKSIAGQMQLKKRCNGTILSSISKDEFDKIVIPKVKYKKQQEIKNLIQKMYCFLGLSRSTLDVVKIGIEKAIDENEEKAMKWIEKEVDSLNID